MALVSTTAPRLEELEELERENEAMTDEDRQEALADIYGTGKPLPETPELLAEKLAALRVALDGIPRDRHSRAYQTAQERLAAYVNSSEFLLPFLRADLFVVETTANKVIKYWAMRLQLFGEATAFDKPLLRLTDLTDDDLASLRNEGLTLMPDKDQAGRALLVSTRQKWTYEHKESHARLFFYLLQSAINGDVEMQQNGIVFIAFDDGDFIIRKHFNRKLDRLVLGVIHSMPIRTTGVHHFTDSKVASIVHPFLLSMCGRKFRSRYRMYGANNKEKRTSLLECGISMDILPTRMGGASAVTPALFLEARQQVEAGEEEEDTNPS